VKSVSFYLERFQDMVCLKKCTTFLATLCIGQNGRTGGYSMLTAKGRIAAATYRIALSLSTACEHVLRALTVKLTV